MGTCTWRAALSRSRKYSYLSAHALPRCFEGSAARLIVFDGAPLAVEPFGSTKLTSHALGNSSLRADTFINQFIFSHALQSYIMASSNTAFRCVVRLQQCGRCSNVFRLTLPTARSIHSGSRIPTITASSSRLRPKIQSFVHQPNTFSQPTPVTSRRTIFIQTENTPNADVRDIECLFII